VRTSVPDDGQDVFEAAAAARVDLVAWLIDPFMGTVTDQSAWRLICVATG